MGQALFRLDAGTMSQAPVAVITGTTHGIGRVTSLGLARAGYTVVMLCRDVPAASTRWRGRSCSRSPGERGADVVHCDLASLASVRAAAREVLERCPRIDRLINNAGIVSTRRRFSVDGHELTFATNHLGPFLLTRLLRPALAPDARIINVSSKVHYRGRLDLDSVDDPRAGYSSTAAYSCSKLANVRGHLWPGPPAVRRGTGITVNCLHPGVVALNLPARLAEPHPAADQSAPS